MEDKKFGEDCEHKDYGRALFCHHIGNPFSQESTAGNCIPSRCPLGKHPAPDEKELFDYIREFLTLEPHAKMKKEILEGKVFYCDETEEYFFRLIDMCNFLSKKKHFDFDSPLHIQNYLQDNNFKMDSLVIATQSIVLIKIHKKYIALPEETEKETKNNALKTARKQAVEMLKSEYEGDVWTCPCDLYERILELEGWKD